MSVNLFSHFFNLRLPNSFSSVHGLISLGTDGKLQTWDSHQVYAFPSLTMISQVLDKLMSSRGVEMILIVPDWSKKEWFLNPLDLL